MGQNRHSINATGGTRKMANRRLAQAKNEAQKNAIIIESRIKLLDSEEVKMQRKIEKTRRMAEKIAINQEMQEEKLDRMQKVDD